MEPAFTPAQWRRHILSVVTNWKIGFGECVRAERGIPSKEAIHHDVTNSNRFRGPAGGERRNYQYGPVTRHSALHSEERIPGRGWLSSLSAAESLELLLESLEDVLEPWKLYPASVNTLVSPCLSCEANEDWLDVEIFAATQDLPRMRRRKILESLPLKPSLLLPASHARPPKTGSK